MQKDDGRKIATENGGYVTKYKDLQTGERIWATEDTEEPTREPKQGEEVEAKYNERDDTWCREFICKYKGKYLCSSFGPNLQPRYDLYDSVYKIEKPTLKSQFEKLDKYLSIKTSDRYDRIKTRRKETEPFVK